MEVSENNLSSYRCRVHHGEYDPSEPELNSQVVGCRAESRDQAMHAVAAATGGRVIDAWRQDGLPEARPGAASNVERVSGPQIDALLAAMRAHKGFIPAVGCAR